jgi:hypothetical protein
MTMTIYKYQVQVYIYKERQLGNKWQKYNVSNDTGKIKCIAIYQKEEET